MSQTYGIFAGLNALSMICWAPSNFQLTELFLTTQMAWRKRQNLTVCRDAENDCGNNGMVFNFFLITAGVFQSYVTYIVHGCLLFALFFCFCFFSS